MGLWHSHLEHMQRCWQNCIVEGFLLQSSGASEVEGEQDDLRPRYSKPREPFEAAQSSGQERSSPELKTFQWTSEGRPAPSWSFMRESVWRIAMKWDFLTEYNNWHEYTGRRPRILSQVMAVPCRIGNEPAHELWADMDGGLTAIEREEEGPDVLDWLTGW
jgi:hypothetical protein